MGNSDGTLTNEGRKRYGVQDGESGPLGNKNTQGRIRKQMIGDYKGATWIQAPSTTQRHRAMREERLEKKVNKYNIDKSKKENYESKLKAQREKNIDIEKYLSKTSTGKLFLQNYLLSPYVADAYRSARARGEKRGSAFIESMMPRLNLNLLNNESVLAKRRDKKKYGDLGHTEI